MIRMQTSAPAMSRVQTSAAANHRARTSAPAMSVRAIATVWGAAR